MKIDERFCYSIMFSKFYSMTQTHIQVIHGLFPMASCYRPCGCISTHILPSPCHYLLSNILMKMANAITDITKDLTQISHKNTSPLFVLKVVILILR